MDGNGQSVNSLFLQRSIYSTSSSLSLSPFVYLLLLKVLIIVSFFLFLFFLVVFFAPLPLYLHPSSTIISHLLCEVMQLIHFCALLA